MGKKRRQRWRDGRGREAARWRERSRHWWQERRSPTAMRPRECVCVSFSLLRVWVRVSLYEILSLFNLFFYLLFDDLFSVVSFTPHLLRLLQNPSPLPFLLLYPPCSPFSFALDHFFLIRRQRYTFHCSYSPGSLLPPRIGVPRSHDYSRSI